MRRLTRAPGRRSKLQRSASKVGKGVGAGVGAGVGTLVARFEPSNLTPIFQPNHQTLEGSFSAVSRPIFATKYSFFSILRDLEDMQSFAPLRSQNFSKKSAKKFVIFSNFCKITIFFRIFSVKCASILMRFSRNFAESSRKY